MLQNVLKIYRKTALYNRSPLTFLGISRSSKAEAELNLVHSSKGDLPQDTQPTGLKPDDMAAIDEL